MACLLAIGKKRMEYLWFCLRLSPSLCEDASHVGWSSSHSSVTSTLRSTLHIERSPQGTAGYSLSARSLRGHDLIHKKKQKGSVERLEGWLSP